MRYKIEHTSEDTYTRIFRTSELGDEIKCVGIACKIAQERDWLIELGFVARDALVLREYDDLLFVIGRAVYTSLYLDTPPILVGLDADDAVVLLCGSQFSCCGTNDGTYLEDNMEQILALVNNRVCREWGSSLAMLPAKYGVNTSQQWPQWTSVFSL